MGSRRQRDFDIESFDGGRVFENGVEVLCQDFEDDVSVLIVMIVLVVCCEDEGGFWLNVCCESTYRVSELSVISMSST